MTIDQRVSPRGKHVLNLTCEIPGVSEGTFGLGGISPQGEAFAFTNYYLTRNGRPHIPIMGEFHFSRFPRQYWEQELRKMQAGGVTIVATYIFWIHVEEDEGIFDWSGDRDVRLFVEICQKVGLSLVLRVGPFAHGECRNGGLPDWLYGRAIQVRSNDEQYLAYVKRYYDQVGEQVRGLLFEDGGPIIGFQLENEYMHCGAPWEVTPRQGSEWVPAGEDGSAHLQTLQRLAIEAGLRAPIYTATAWVGSPIPKQGLLPMHGGYAFTPWIPDPDFRQGPTHEFLFRDRHQQPLANAEVTYEATRYPYVSCELGSGIQITYHHRPIVPPECSQAMAVVALGSGSNWIGYYMYHGGSNPVGKHSYLNEYTVPRISYDFQAPVREYGQLNASYHRLKALHYFLHDFDALLAPMRVALPQGSQEITPEDTQTLRYSARHDSTSGFLFLNNYQDHAELQDHEGVQIQVDLPNETLTIPHSQEGFTLRQGVSAILPFNLRLAGNVLLKYATAQLLMKLENAGQTTYIFFAPTGMAPELAFEKTTYRQLEVAAGTKREEEAWSYVSASGGLEFQARITSHDGREVQVLVLTQEQAMTAWKLPLWGEERLVLADAFIFNQEDELHCNWQGEEALHLAFYPPLQQEPASPEGSFTTTERSVFTQATLHVPEQHFELQVEQVNAQTLKLALPALALEPVQDVFLHIDYLGDTGQAFLDGRLVADHFANGTPWEIGLKRFLCQDEVQELVLRLNPIRQNAQTLSYFPTGMAFRPSTDGFMPIEIRSITSRLEYHARLASTR
ncbi:hypothetical protein KSD_64930 [Ktedonobacter sp. SOSP1-85]|uniref:beta-galactosidase n=1 Tax=Ktedonobacter sp. SOSP1-85 TaxID=2778367 RepID=UPI001915FC10|nr:beta-galactosidase [Ktedonobacter sp. SOSP1-85]GHO78722.1 hypothetical protein KSD_64930 [Ktedonobacter sp. SOSP1-85]